MPGMMLGCCDEQCNDDVEGNAMQCDEEIGMHVNSGKLAHFKHDENNTIVLKAKIAKLPCTVMPDTGASHSIIDSDFLHKTGLVSQVRKAPVPLQLNIAGDTHVTLTHAIATTIQIGGMQTHIVMYVMPKIMQDIDVIIGVNFMRPLNGSVHLGLNELHLTVNNKRFCLPGVSTEVLGVAAMQQCFADRDGYITHKQAAKLLKRGCKGYLFMVQQQPTQDNVVPLTAEQEAISKVSTEHGKVFDAKLKAEMQKVMSIFMPHTSLPKNKALFPVIPTYPDAQPPYRKQNLLSPLEASEADKQVKDLLAKGFIPNPVLHLTAHQYCLLSKRITPYVCALTTEP